MSPLSAGSTRGHGAIDVSATLRCAMFVHCAIKNTHLPRTRPYHLRIASQQIVRR